MGRVTTAPVQTTFGYLLQPKVTQFKDAQGVPQNKNKWQVTPLFHTDIPEEAAALQECINDAFATGVEAFGENFWALVEQGSIRWPFRNGADINPKTGQKRFGDNITYFNCSSNTAPDVVSRYYDPADPNKKPRKITDASEYYWGQRAKLNLTFKHYKREDGWGIAVYVNGAQLWHDGDRIGEGQFSAQDEFDAEGAPEAAYAQPGQPPASAPPAVGGQPPVAGGPPQVGGGAPPAGVPPVGGPPQVGAGAGAPPTAQPPAVGGPPQVGGAPRNPLL